jgi:hypothetical protein
MGNSIQRISITVVSFCIGFIACIVALREWVIAKEILPSLATLIAAFFGAWFAFSLQSMSKKKEERNKKISYQYYSIEYWKEAIGQRLYFTLQRTTEDLISNVDNPVQSNIEIKDRLIEAFKSLFPGEKFFNFDLNGEPPNHANTADTKICAAD